MFKNPNVYTSNSLVDDSFEIKLNYPSIFDANSELDKIIDKPPVIISASGFAKNVKPVSIDDLKVKDIKIKNPNTGNLDKYSEYQNADKSITDTINANEALKDRNIYAFEEIMGREPTLNEIAQKSISTNKNLAEILKPVENKKETVSISFDDPYGEDRDAFNKYLEKLIKEGKKYVLKTNEDGSIQVSYKQIPETSSTKKEAPVNSISQYIIRYGLLSNNMDKLLLSKIEKMNRDELNTGLELLGVSVKPELYNDKKQMKEDLRDELVKYINENGEEIKKLYYNIEKEKTIKPLVPDGEEKEDNLQIKKLKKIFKKLSLDVKKQRTGVIGSSTYNAYLLQHRKDFDEIRDMDTSILDEETKKMFDELVDILPSIKKSKKSRKNEEEDEQDSGAEETPKKKKSQRGKGLISNSPEEIRKRVKIGFGEIEAGNDSDLLKTQLKKDLNKAVRDNIKLPIPKTKIRDLVKKLL